MVQHFQLNMAGSLSWPTSNSTTSSVTVHPASLARHPTFWSKEEVGVWLKWCTEEYSIEPVPADKFDLNGKALCLLSRNDFMERVPKNGDVLFNSLCTVISKQTGSNMLNQNPVQQLSPNKEPHYQYQVTARSPTSPNQQREAVNPSVLIMPPVSGSHLLAGLPMAPTSMTTIAPPPFVPIRPQSFISVPSRGLPEEMMKSFVKETMGVPECRLLWEFIYQLLCNSKYSNYVSWENKDEFVFRIINPTGLAELWGQQKNRTNMTYEKLSRALRYYYRMNIIKKVPGKRLTYRFLQSPNKIQKGQRGAKPQYKLQQEYRDTLGASSRGESHEPQESALSIKTESDDTSESSNVIPEEFDDNDNSGDEDDNDSLCDIEDLGGETLPQTPSSPISVPVSNENGTKQHKRPDSRDKNCEDVHLPWVPTSVNDRMPMQEIESPTNTHEHHDTAIGKFLIPPLSHHLSLPDLGLYSRRTYRARSTDNLQPLSPNVVSNPSFLTRATISPPYYNASGPHAQFVEQYRVVDSPEYPRSRSCHVAQSVQFPSYTFRPHQPGYVSPGSVVQNEPEDLSVRSRSDNHTSTSTKERTES